MEGRTLEQLKQECRTRGLPVSGTKAQLIKRIQDDIYREAEANDDMLYGPMPGAHAGPPGGIEDADILRAMLSNPAFMRAAMMAGGGAYPPGLGGYGGYGDSDDDDMDSDDDGMGFMFGGRPVGPMPVEAQAAKDAELQVQTNAAISNAAKARFKEFFGVNPEKAPTYVSTKAAWHWTDNPEPIPLPLEEDQSSELLDAARAILSRKVNFTSSGPLVVQPVLSVKGLKVDPDISEWPPKDLMTRIYEMATDSPFGKGTETVIDKSVRSCRQLDPSQFEIKNAQFRDLYGSDSTKSPVLEKIRKDLAPQCAKIRSELYKMLIYKKGDFFKEHRDTQRGGDMFATLVVSPPLDGQGGALYVSHAGEKEQFSFYEGGYAAFFADCLHEVSQVYSGYRISFVYNLMRDGPSAPADDGSGDLKTICDTISQILTLEKGDVYVGHLLEHKYALSLLNGPTALKGRDAKLFELISAHPNIETLITPIEILVSGHGYDDDGQFERDELADDEPEYTAVRTWAIDPGVSRKGNAGNISYSVMSNTCLQELKVVFIEEESKLAVQVGSDFHPSGNEGTTAAYTYVHGAMIFKLKKAATAAKKAASPAPAKRGGMKRKR